MILGASACEGSDQPGSADAAEPDATPNQALVFEQAFGCSFSEIYERVVVTHEDGSPGAVAPIVPGGTAVEVEPGAAITAVTARGALQTVVGVQPGDVLTFGEFCGPRDTAFEITATWEIAAGASYYVACTRCYCEPTAPGGLSLGIGSCSEAGATDDLFVVAMDSTGVPVGFSWRSEVVVSPGATVSAGPWEVPATLTMRVEELPEGASIIVSSGIRFGSSYLAEDERSVGSGPASWTRSAAPMGAPVHASTELDAELLVEAVPAGTPTWTLSVASRLPVVTSFTFDPATRVVSFELRGGEDYDAAVVDLVWPLGDGLARPWRLVVPAGTTSLPLPQHPDLSETSAPDTGQPSFARIALIERADIASYDAVRAVPLWAMRNGYMAVLGGASGLVRWATFEPL